MIPTEKQIEDIAELLDCGMVCFYHRSSGTIEHYPDPDNPYFEQEQWQDLIDKIEADRGNYDRFDKMDSRQGFRVMEDFANTVTDSNFQNKLFERLNQRKPFSKFKMIVENSNYRQKWFDFKQQAYINWVKEQLN